MIATASSYNPVAPEFLQMHPGQAQQVVGPRYQREALLGRCQVTLAIVEEGEALPPMNTID